MILRNSLPTTPKFRPASPANGLFARLPDSLPLGEILVLAAIGLGLMLA